MKRIPLTKGLVALVDDVDYERVMEHKWCASIESRGTKVYAIRWSKVSDPEHQEAGRQVKIRMHRWLMGMPKWIPGGLIVDHRDRDGLNNQKESNLRKATQKFNMTNAGGWKRKCEPCL